MKARAFEAHHNPKDDDEIPFLAHVSPIYEHNNEREIGNYLRILGYKVQNSVASFNIYIASVLLSAI